jgi:membrane protein DedA with SNARE-associated domain
MGLKVGLVVGFAVGYYLGAKAGRERYEQLDRLLRRARNTDIADAAADKAKAVIDLSVERARDLFPQPGTTN